MHVVEPNPNRTTYGGKLLIFTTFYECRSHSRYTQSMVETARLLERLGVNFGYLPIHGDFHVERACNEAVAIFLNDPEATDLLIIDSDESWDVMAVMRLLSHAEEVVGCAYRMKNAWDKYTVSLTLEGGQPVGKILKDGTALLRAERLPAGFLRIKKSAARKFVEAFPDEWYWGGPKDAPIKIPVFFKTEIRDHQFFSQDYNLSERLKEIGVLLWCDPNADITHHGMTAYDGNLDKHLRGLKKTQAEEAAFAEVGRMAQEIKARAA